jgi:hypothetical protein
VGPSDEEVELLRQSARNQAVIERSTAEEEARRYVQEGFSGEWKAESVLDRRILDNAPTIVHELGATWVGQFMKEAKPVSVGGHVSPVFPIRWDTIGGTLQGLGLHERCLEDYWLTQAFNGA